jgi:hypothetical protein
MNIQDFGYHFVSIYIYAAMASDWYISLLIKISFYSC